MARLARHRFPRHPDCGGIGSRQLEDLQRRKDRGERIAQLVPQHRQELVLAPVRERQLLELLLQSLRGAFVPVDLRRERERFLLQLHDRPLVRVGRHRLRKPFRRNDAGMLGAHLQELLGLRVMRKRVQRIGAVQRERVPRGEAVPELLEGDRGVGVAIGVQQRDHFAERVDVAVPRRERRDATPSQ